MADMEAGTSTSTKACASMSMLNLLRRGLEHGGVEEVGMRTSMRASMKAHASRSMLNLRRRGLERGVDGGHGSRNENEGESEHESTCELDVKLAKVGT